VKNRFQSLPFKFNLQRYTAAAAAKRAAAVSYATEVANAMELYRMYPGFHHEAGLYRLNSVYP
jgi:hypothetical protein